MGLWPALLGIVVPGAVIMAMTLSAVIWAQLQGILLTALALGFFIAAMMLMPKVTAAGSQFWSLPIAPATPPEA
jgi:hypothetical protein